LVPALQCLRAGARGLGQEAARPQVTFRRIPVAFTPGQEPLQRLYYAIEALGQVDAMHRKVFTALHVERKRLNTESDILDWAKAQGMDTTKLGDTMKSFAVATKLRQSKQLSDGYRIEGVPTLGIQGRFMTSPSIAGTAERALAVADALIAQSRKRLTPPACGRIAASCLPGRPELGSRMICKFCAD
jgi:thiol:disulfide interchange protein DsbA